MDFKEKLESVIKNIDSLLSKEEIGEEEIAQIDALHAAFEKSEEEAPAEEEKEEAAEEAPAEEAAEAAEEAPAEEPKEETAKSAPFTWATGDFNAGRKEDGTRV